MITRRSAIMSAIGMKAAAEISATAPAMETTKAKFIIGATASEGADPCCYSIIRKIRDGRLREVGSYREKAELDVFARYLFTVGRLYNTATIAVDVVGSGSVVQHNLLEMGYVNLYQSRQRYPRFGFWPSISNTKIAIDSLNNGLREGRVELPTRVILPEDPGWLALAIGVFAAAEMDND